MRLRRWLYLVPLLAASCLLQGQDIGRGAMFDDAMNGSLGGAMGIDDGLAACDAPPSPCVAGTTLAYMTAWSTDGDCYRPSSTETAQTPLADLSETGDLGGYTCANCPDLVPSTEAKAAYFAFDAAATEYYQTATGRTTPTDDAYTIVAIFAAPDATNYYGLHGGESGSYPALIRIRATSTLLRTASETAVESGALSVAQYHGISILFSGVVSTSARIVDDIAKATVNHGDRGFTQSFFGAGNNATFPFLGRVKALAICEGDSVDEGETWRDLHYGPGWPRDQTAFGISALGDSVTLGAYGTTTYPEELATLNGLNVHNDGLGGDNLDEIDTRFDASVIGRPYDDVIIMGGINDVADGRSSAQMIASFNSIVTKVLANGSRPICLTATPATTFGTAGEQTIIDAYNAHVLAYAPCAFNVDVWTPLEHLTVPYTLLTLMDHDGVHPNDLGKQTIASTVDAAVY